MVGQETEGIVNGKVKSLNPTVTPRYLAVVVAGVGRKAEATKGARKPSPRHAAPPVCVRHCEGRARAEEKKRSGDLIEQSWPRTVTDPRTQTDGRTDRKTDRQTKTDNDRQ